MARPSGLDIVAAAKAHNGGRQIASTFQRAAYTSLSSCFPVWLVHMT